MVPCPACQSRCRWPCEKNKARGMRLFRRASTRLECIRRSIYQVLRHSGLMVVTCVNMSGSRRHHIVPRLHAWPSWSKAMLKALGRQQACLADRAWSCRIWPSAIGAHLNFCAGTPAMSSMASSNRRWFSLIVNAPMPRSARISVVTYPADQMIIVRYEHVDSNEHRNRNGAFLYIHLFSGLLRARFVCKLRQLCFVTTMHGDVRHHCEDMTEPMQFKWSRAATRAP